MKKTIVLLLCCMCIALSGCSIEVDDMKTEEKISSFDGVWRQIDLPQEVYMEAVVEGNTIVMSMIYDNGQSSAVYWHGTIPTLTKSVTGYQWVSVCDVSKIHPDLISVSDRQKQFFYIDGRIWFPHSAGDTSVIIRMERVDE